MHSWSSYQLQTQIGYKTRLLGIRVEYIDPHYTSQICSKCRHMVQREGKNFKCLDCGHVDHADVNASFNIGKPIPPHILDQFDIDRDISKGSSDTPKEATLINDKDLETMKPLEPPRSGVCQYYKWPSFLSLITNLQTGSPFAALCVVSISAPRSFSNNSVSMEHASQWFSAMCIIGQLYSKRTCFL